MSRRFALLAVASLLGSVVTAPLASAAAGGSGGSANPPRPLPAHSQRAVCGTPAAKAARCNAHVVTYQDSATPLATVNYSSGWRPVDLKAAYKLPSTGAPGTGPLVAIVDAYNNPNAESDLAAYRAQFGLGTCTSSSPSGCFQKVNQAGATSPMPTGDTGWGAEIDLDIEMVSAACPSCRILLVEANSNSFNDLIAAVDRAYLMGATFISNSYGGPEFSGETSYDSHFNHPGVAITVSSGDNGYGVEYPAASQYVTAVGGTSLATAANARGWTETTWSGAGSGCSGLEPKPSWQHDSGCSRRTVADVSAVANPNTGVAVYDSFGSSGGANWFVYGGTSVAAPFVAGVWALGPTIGGSVKTGGIPYANAGTWFDVTSGANTSRCRSGYLCQAGTGYDGPTGLGTPNGISGFATAGGGGNNPPVASFTSSCTDLTCSFTNTSTDSDGSIASSSWTFGDGGTSTSTSPSHGYTSAGNYPVTLTVKDNGGLTSSVSHSVSPTAPAGGITLTATGSKTRGSNTVNLSWTGTSGSVDIYRNGQKFTTDNASPYTDNLGTKGSATYSYKVCVAGTSTCSNTATVTF